MKVLFKKIPLFSSKIVDIYTVILGKNELTEFELFDKKDFSQHVIELQLIYNVLAEIIIRGAKHYYFKHEGPANALPKVRQEIINNNKNDFGLRLYCIRLTDHLLILLNGDVKTRHLPQDCENVSIHFKRAIKIANQLDAANLNNEIDFSDFECLTDFEIDI